MTLAPLLASDGSGRRAACYPARTAQSAACLAPRLAGRLTAEFLSHLLTGRLLYAKSFADGHIIVQLRLLELFIRYVTGWQWITVVSAVLLSLSPSIYVLLAVSAVTQLHSSLVHPYFLRLSVLHKHV